MIFIGLKYALCLVISNKGLFCFHYGMYTKELVAKGLCITGPLFMVLYSESRSIHNSGGYDLGTFQFKQKGSAVYAFLG